MQVIGWEPNTKEYYKSILQKWCAPAFCGIKLVSGPYKFAIRNAKSPHRIMLLSLLQWIMWFLTIVAKGERYPGPRFNIW